MSNYEKLTKEIGSLLDDMAARKFGVETYLKALEAVERLTELSYRILDLEKKSPSGVVGKEDDMVIVVESSPAEWKPLRGVGSRNLNLEEACEAIQALKNSSLPPQVIDVFLTEFKKLHDPSPDEKGVDERTVRMVRAALDYAAANGNKNIYIVAHDGEVVSKLVKEMSPSTLSGRIGILTINSPYVDMNMDGIRVVGEHPKYVFVDPVAVETSFPTLVDQLRRFDA